MQFHKPQRQPIAAVSPFVMHVTRKAMHQVDSEIADFRLLERLCHRWRRELGRIEFPAAILNAGDQLGGRVLGSKLNCSEIAAVQSATRPFSVPITPN